VIKVDTAWILESLIRFNGRESSRESEALGYVERKSKRYFALREFFGKAAVLDISVTAQKFPLTAGIVFEVCKEVLSRFPSEITTPVLEQRYLNSLGADGTLSFSSGYLEDIAEVSDEQYARLTEALLSGGSSVSVEEEFETFYGRRGCEALFAALRSNQGTRRAMLDFLRRAIAYSRETRETLDIAGQGNVVFVLDSREHRVFLPDALAPGEGNSITAAVDVLNAFASGATVTRRERFLVFNVLHYVRLINGVCALVGLDERVSMPGLELRPLATKLGELLRAIRERTSVT